MDSPLNFGKVGGIKNVDGRKTSTPNEPKYTSEQNPSFMTFRRYFKLKMLTVSSIASYAFGYRKKKYMVLIALFQFVSIWSISTQNEIIALLHLYFLTARNEIKKIKMKKNITFFQNVL